MTPENFTDDQIRELAPEFVHKTIENFEDEPFWTLPYPGEIHTHHPDRGAFSLLLQTRLELKEAREQLDRKTVTISRESPTFEHLEALFWSAVPNGNEFYRYGSYGFRYGIEAIMKRFFTGHKYEFEAINPSPPETQAPTVAGKRTLDLRGIVERVNLYRLTRDQVAAKDGAYVAFSDFALIFDTIRAQLPDIEVLT